MIKKKQPILIIDDEEDILNALSEILNELNFLPVAAQTLPTALIKINNQCFSTILLDICLKKVSGLKIVDQIRRNYLSMNHDTPIIFHSGHIESDILDKYKNDVDDAIVKPVDIFLMNEKLSYWTNQKHNAKIQTPLYLKNTIIKKAQ